MYLLNMQRELFVFPLEKIIPEFPVKIYPTRNMGEEDEKKWGRGRKIW